MAGRHILHYEYNCTMIPAAYARYSSDNQRESSIDDQLRNCRQWAERHGLTLSLIYADRAMSGTRHNRPEYQRMLADAQAGKFNVLLVDTLSRLSRNNAGLQKTLERLQFFGVRVVSASDGYDSQQQGSKLQSGLRGIINEVYVDDLRHNIHKGLTGKALQQFSAGGRSYGYRSQAIEDPTRLDEYGRPTIDHVRKAAQTSAAVIVVSASLTASRISSNLLPILPGSCFGGALPLRFEYFPNTQKRFV